MKGAKIKRLTEVALLVSLLCVGSQIAIPTIFLVPITIQVLLVGIIGYFLSLKWSLATILVYVSIGAIGVPVFANFGGGLGTLFGYTGGFVFGFIPLVIMCSLGKGRAKILFGIIGVILCHFVGIIQYSLVAKLPIITSFLTMSLPYIFKDFVLAVLAFFVANLVKIKLKRQS